MELPKHPPTVSDLDVAAQHADLEIRSVVEQLANARVTAAVSTSNNNSNNAAPTANESDDDSDGENGRDGESAAMKDSSSSLSSDSDDDDDDGDDEDEESRAALRAEIEEALEKEESRAAAGPLKTANEIAAVPVREPSVELTPDCPIARCGTILNVSAPGLMITIKSDANAKPLDEESVLCLEDRTVIGCVDEVFGPVLMPMYLVRFESADKMPAKATVGTTVYFATEHTTYIVPEDIKDKGTDASNIFDEETDEAVYSDDEAESAAKRQNRKRNRGGNASELGQQHGDANSNSSNSTGTGDTSSGGHRTSSYSDHRHSAQTGSNNSASSSNSHGGRGGGQGGGGRGGATAGRTNYTQTGSAPVQFQTQSHGGQTFYTQPGFVAPSPHAGFAPAHVGYAAPPPPPMGYGQPPPPPMPYSQVSMHQPPAPHHPFAPQPQFPHPFQQQAHMGPYPPPLPGQQFYPPAPPMPQPYHAVPPQFPPQQQATNYFPAAGQPPPPHQPPLPPGPYEPSRS